MTAKWRQCDHCLLKGHIEKTCHVKAEGREKPDTADRIACRIARERGWRGGNPPKRTMLAEVLRDLPLAELAKLMKEKNQ